jgi:hypothetical protein
MVGEIHGIGQSQTGLMWAGGGELVPEPCFGCVDWVPRYCSFVLYGLVSPFLTGTSVPARA